MPDIAVLKKEDDEQPTTSQNEVEGYMHLNILLVDITFSTESEQTKQTYYFPNQCLIMGKHFMIVGNLRMMVYA